MTKAPKPSRQRKAARIGIGARIYAALGMMTALTIVSTGVAGLSATPALLPSARIASISTLRSPPLSSGISVGSTINIPVKRIVREQPVWSHPMAIWGLDRTLPRWTIRRRETIIAVNVGGCMIPVLLMLVQITSDKTVGGMSTIETKKKKMKFKYLKKDLHR